MTKKKRAIVSALTGAPIANSERDTRAAMLAAASNYSTRRRPPSLPKLKFMEITEDKPNGESK